MSTVTVYVWILLASYVNGHGGNPIVIDNIATKAECQRVAQVLKGTTYGTELQCVQVMKAR